MNPQGKRLATHWRVPVDDTHTYIIWCEFTPSDDGSEVIQKDSDIPVSYIPDGLRPDGEYNLTDFAFQDQMAWETQGAIYDRSKELLGVSDRGIAMWRRMLLEQIELVQDGKDPGGVIRDPKLNTAIKMTLSGGQALMAREMEQAK